MRCLHCGKEISSHAELTEQKNRWHRRCIKKFFGTKELPMLDITEEQLLQLVLLQVSVTEKNTVISETGQILFRSRIVSDALTE